jgi:hypothetical protein
MKILKWWKEVELMPGVRYKIVNGEVNSNQQFFESILEAVRNSSFDYTLTSRSEVVEEDRGLA